jgi:hypothetical protein
MNYNHIIFSRHAFGRMFAREISPEFVSRAVKYGEIIASYPDDMPFPSFLLLYQERGRSLHVVVGKDQNENICFVITVYRPDPALWSEDFRQRRP